LKVRLPRSESGGFWSEVNSGASRGAKRIEPASSRSVYGIEDASAEERILLKPLRKHKSTNDLQVDIPPMKAEARKLESKIRKLVRRIEDEPDEGLCAAYDRRIRELQRDLKPLNEQIRDAERQDRKREKGYGVGRARGRRRR